MSASPLVAGSTIAAQVRGIRVAGVGAAGVALAGASLELGTLCPLRGITGIPCPLCGLTRGVAEVAGADVGGAVAAHPLALVAVALLVVVWTPLGPRVVDQLRRRPAAIAAVLGVVWVARLVGLYGS